MADQPKIFVNGQEINPQAMEQLPESVRQVLVDANRNGVPDIVENVMNNPMVQKVLANTNLDQLPGPAREMVHKMLNNFGTPSLGAKAPPSPRIDWKAIEQAEAPKTIPLKVVIFSVAVIFALILAGWIVLMAWRSS